MSGKKETLLAASGIVRKAGAELLEVEQLGIEDVYRYLSANEQATLMILEYHTGKKNHPNELSKALLEWERDKSKSFYIMLMQIDRARKERLPDVMDVLARCSRAVVESPLIPSVEVSAYARARDFADIVYQQGFSEKSVEPITTAFYEGTMYNAAQFCPEIFTDTITEATIQHSRNLFEQSLNILQGRPPVVH